MRVLIVIAALLCVGGNAVAGDCAGGKCQSAARVRVAVAAPVVRLVRAPARVVTSKSRAVVRERVPLLPWRR